MNVKPRVVILGGGFGGIASARALRLADAEVLVVDRRNHQIFQPLLYHVATAVLSPADIAAPIRQMEQRQQNLSVLLAEVTGVDLAGRTVEVMAPGSGSFKVTFDYLIVATGSRPSYFGHDEYARYAPSLKNLGDAEVIRSKILGALEKAVVTKDEAERERQMTFVLVGAGPTGVELAASLAHLMRTTLSNNFRNIHPSEARIVLIDGSPRVLPTFSDHVSVRVARRLERLGVEIMTGIRVEAVDENGVIAGGKRITSATVLWTAGVQASPVVRMLGTQTDRAGRALVDPFLRVAAGVFVVGDAAALTLNGHPVPGVAQAAIQEGRYVGRLIANEMKGGPAPSQFSYFDLGNMAVVGKNYAVLQRGMLITSGLLTFFLWACVHIMALPLLQNRLRVQRQWLWSYLTGQRGSRLISEKPSAT